MGVLDEAIREHLELKRRHGADPGEIARIEQEALGPARRGASEPVEAAAAPADDAPTTVHEAPTGDAPAAVPADGADNGEYVLSDDEEFEYEYEYDEPESPPTAPSALQPTAEFAVEDELAPAQPPPPASEEEWEDDWDDSDEEPPPPPAAAAPDAGEKGDDVLEETPEFLQETPEHDRLWFEQKPPRDFDF